MSRLAVSGCEFNRNGNWYTAAEAVPHLLRKMQYFEDNGSLQTVEQFIDLAASGSSISGQPYLVKCGSNAAVPSGTWLRSQLLLLRPAGRAQSTP